MTPEFRKGRALEALSMTPLIDVVFLLLIFFLVTARFEEEAAMVSVRRRTLWRDIIHSDAWRFLLVGQELSCKVLVMMVMMRGINGGDDERDQRSGEMDSLAVCFLAAW